MNSTLRRMATDLRATASYTTGAATATPSTGFKWASTSTVCWTSTWARCAFEWTNRTRRCQCAVSRANGDRQSPSSRGKSAASTASTAPSTSTWRRRLIVPTAPRAHCRARTSQSACPFQVSSWQSVRSSPESSFLNFVIYHHHSAEEYMRPDSTWSIGAIIFSWIGILLTVFVIIIFVRYNDTPVVRASGRELCYVLLIGILMCYGMVSRNSCWTGAQGL